MSLWEEFATEVGSDLEEASKDDLPHVLAVKNGRIGDFNGKNISTISCTSVDLDPQVPETNNLKEWAQAPDRANLITPLTMRNTMMMTEASKLTMINIADIKKEDFEEKVVKLFKIKAMISSIRDGDITYNACNAIRNGRQCNKKMTTMMDDDQRWWCELCQKETNEEHYRYHVMLTIMDHTGYHYIVSFDNEANKIFNVSAAQYVAMNDEEKIIIINVSII